MPIQTEYPTGLGTEDSWALNGAASKLAAVSSDDADTSFVYADSGGRLNVQRFTFPTLVGVADPITSAVLYAKVREQAPGGGGRSFYFEWNSAYVGTNYGPTIHVGRPNYVTLSTTVATPLLAAVNGEHGFRMTAAGGPTSKWEIWATLFYRTVEFTYGAGSADSFAHLVGSLAAAIGAGILLREMPELARDIWTKTGTLLKPSEYEDAFRAWRDRRHTRTFA